MHFLPIPHLVSCHPGPHILQKFKCNSNKHLLSLWNLFFYCPLSTLNSSNSLSLQVTPSVKNHSTPDLSLVSETEYGKRRWPCRHEIKSHCGRASRFTSLAQLLIRARLCSFPPKLQISSAPYKPLCWISRNVTEQGSTAETT